jgi:hypothetical protein
MGQNAALCALLLRVSWISWANISHIGRWFNFVNVHDDVIEGSGDQKLTDLAQGVTWHIRQFKPSLLTAPRPLLLAFVIVPETQVIA